MVVPMVNRYTIIIEVPGDIERVGLVQLLRDALMRSDTRALVRLNEIVKDVHSP